MIISHDRADRTSSKLFREVSRLSSLVGHVGYAVQVVGGPGAVFGVIESSAHDLPSSPGCMAFRFHRDK